MATTDLLNFKCVKQLSEVSDLKTIPSTYAYSTTPIESFPIDDQDSIPIVDFSLLTSTNERSKVVEELGKACQDWGFFMLVNHGIPVSLMKEMVNASIEFFNLAEEEKAELDGKHALAPIRYGTSFNKSIDKVFFWRDFLKVIVHPQFTCPNKPHNFSDLLSEYSQRTREVILELLKGVSESLGLEDVYMQEALKLESDGFQLFVANYYPRCPQPQLAMGMPPHSDHGLLTFLIDNQVGGLQIQHKGKWINITTSIPGAILVNVGDHLEIFSNGKYKSVLHRAVVNNSVTRTSVGTVLGPSLETTVRPAQQLVEAEACPPAYIPMKYKDYLEQQQNNQLDAKSCLDQLRKTV